MQRILYGLVGLLVILSIITFLLPSRIAAEDSMIIANVSGQAVFLQSSKEDNLKKWLPAGTSVTVGEIKPVSLVVANMNYAGFDGKSVMRFEKANNGIKISWSHDAKVGNSPLARFSGWNASRQLKSDMAESLKKLRAICEEQAGGQQKAVNESSRGVSFAGFEVKEISYPSTDFIICRKKLNMRDMPGHFANYFPLIYTTAQSSGLVVDGNPTALFYDWDETGGMVDVAAAIPVKQAKTLDQEMVALNLPARKALQVEFKGNPDKVSQAHLAISQYLAQNNLSMDSPTVEEYISDPNGQDKPEDMVTRVTAFYK
ncbi:MAG: GyrI-like domain-containing protein [Bacteroidota bacterium]